MPSSNTAAPPAPLRVEGWILTAVVTSAIAAVSLGALATTGAGEAGLRLVLRLTGRASTVLFCLAFSASALFRLRRGPATTWLRRNRRFVGVAFAGSQTIHLLALVGLASASAAFRAGVDGATVAVGGMAYVFTFLMAATSFDGAVARLGRHWRTLHLVGGWWIWAVLLITTLPDAGRGVASALLAALIVGTAALRIAAARSRREARAR